MKHNPKARLALEPEEDGGVVGALRWLLLTVLWDYWALRFRGGGPFLSDFTVSFILWKELNLLEKSSCGRESETYKRLYNDKSAGAWKINPKPSEFTASFLLTEPKEMNRGSVIILQIVYSKSLR